MLKRTLLLLAAMLFVGVVAVPAWARFMVAATSERGDEWFDMPDSVANLVVCRLSGQRATDRCHLPVFEPAPFDPEHPDILAGSALVQLSTWRRLMKSGASPMARAVLSNSSCCLSGVMRRNRSPGCL